MPRENYIAGMNALCAMFAEAFDEHMRNCEVTLHDARITAEGARICAKAMEAAPTRIKEGVGAFGSEFLD